MSRTVLLLLVLSAWSCTDSQTKNPILGQAIEQRVSILGSNYKYLVLSSQGYVGDYKSLLQTTSELFQQNDITQLKSELEKWSNSLDVDLPALNEATLKDDLNISLILLLDQMIIKTLSATASFSEIDPIVFLEKENDSVAFFYVTLHAKDSLFKPMVLLELSSGTLPILVDERTGMAHFTMRKSNKYQKKEFKGSVSYMSGDNAIKMGDFEYPRELISEGD